jgi:hypothetical protein
MLTPRGVRRHQRVTIRWDEIIRGGRRAANLGGHYALNRVQAGAPLKEQVSRLYRACN